MSNNKQGSVEWFINQLEEKGDAWENTSIRRVQISIDVSEYMELKTRAKAIHKEEITQAWKKGDGEFDNVAKQMSLEYYNETFGGQR
jgi:hypothetical protein